MIAVLIGLVLAEGIAISRLLLRPIPPAAFATAEDIARRFKQENVIRKAHPDVDFTRIYTGWTPEDIDLLQRECSTLRYAYAPFVEFRQLPVKQKFVEITPAGYRAASVRSLGPPIRTTSSSSSSAGRPRSDSTRPTTRRSSPSCRTH